MTAFLNGNQFQHLIVILMWKRKFFIFAKLQGHDLLRLYIPIQMNGSCRTPWYFWAASKTFFFFTFTILQWQKSFLPFLVLSVFYLFLSVNMFFQTCLDKLLTHVPLQNCCNSENRARQGGRETQKGQGKFFCSLLCFWMKLKKN